MDGAWVFPTPLDVPEAERGQSKFELRYDDLTQDGHVKLTALPIAIGRACFGQLWLKHPLIKLYEQGVLPILSRLVLEGEAMPTLLGGTVSALGALQLAREDDPAGNVRALMLNTSAEVSGPLGRSHGAQLPEVGRTVVLGRAFAEHVFTKPFAPAGERKVLRFEVPGHAELPDARYQRRSLAHVLALPEGARALDTGFVADPAPWVFGLTHTDHNQHVNSLVYPRLFEDAALRRLHEHAHEHAQNKQLLASALEVVYRKPCFAGDRVVCSLRAFVVGETPGVLGYIGAEGTPPERAHCAIRMLFRCV